MAGMGPRRQLDGTWLYTTIGAALAKVGLDEIRVHIARRYNTVAKYIATYNIMNLCLTAERRPGMGLSRRWWEQPAIDILGIRLRHAEAVMGEETGMEES